MKQKCYYDRKNDLFIPTIFLTTLKKITFSGCTSKKSNKKQRVFQNSFANHFRYFKKSIMYNF